MAENTPDAQKPTQIRNKKKHGFKCTTTHHKPENPRCSLLVHGGECHLLPAVLPSKTFLLKLLIYLHFKQNLKLREIKTKHLQDRLEPPESFSDTGTDTPLSVGAPGTPDLCVIVPAMPPPTPHISLALSPSPPTDNVYLH